ncbi:DUF1643 domain-containing protein [Rhizobium sullae]|uniref:DUF1643 domain-containing protein n=1 Tax=Rhizobium sullae TaxID=50338 RepID=UPI000B353254|nr:DUF1643 domain-containing protein [Rhizobium sullae]
MTDLFGFAMHRDAEFYGPNRLTLTRRWGEGPQACVIGHNPSRAGKLVEDNTSLWWNRWFREFGFGGYDAVNLYPFSTSDPSECRRIVATIEHGACDVRDDLYFVNLPHVVAKAKAAAKVFVCWGAIAWDIDFADHVADEIQSGEGPYPDLWCWGVTSSGAPKHPMARGKHRIPADQKAIMWRAAGI